MYSLPAGDPCWGWWGRSRSVSINKEIGQSGNPRTGKPIQYLLYPHLCHTPGASLGQGQGMSCPCLNPFSPIPASPVTSSGLAVTQHSHVEAWVPGVLGSSPHGVLFSLWHPGGISWTLFLVPAEPTEVTAGPGPAMPDKKTSVEDWPCL